MSIFITATGTNIGKTIFSALIMTKYGKEGLVYWKPIQTGVDDDLSSMKRLSGLADYHFINNTYRFETPASPHIAAEIESKQINETHMLEMYDSVSTRNCVIEGAGGLMVPINRKTLWVDVLEKINIPCILVVSTLLGTINHSLLSLEALKKRNIKTLGFFGIGPDHKLAEDSMTTIRDFSKVPYLGKIHLPEAIQHSDVFFEFTEKNFDLDEKIKHLVLQ
jgi:dethiobiotin synthetase